MDKEKCLNPYCKRPAVTRGLCKVCYTAAHRRVVVLGKTTWEQLIEAGKILPAKPKVTSQTSAWLRGEDDEEENHDARKAASGSTEDRS